MMPIGLYWGRRARQPGGDSERSAAGQTRVLHRRKTTPGAVNGMGNLMGGPPGSTRGRFTLPDGRLVLGKRWTRPVPPPHGKHGRGYRLNS